MLDINTVSNPLIAISIPLSVIVIGIFINSFLKYKEVEITARKEKDIYLLKRTDAIAQEFARLLMEQGKVEINPDDDGIYRVNHPDYGQRSLNMAKQLAAVFNEIKSVLK